MIEGGRPEHPSEPMELALAVPMEESVEGRASTNRARLEAMYRAHHQAIWRFLRRMGHGPELAADATHQAYVVAAERIEQIYLGSERAYLFSTAFRVARGLARKVRRDDLDGEVEHLAAVTRSQSPGGESERRAALDALERILSGLDEALVSVFVLHEIEGFTSPEIAETLGIPVGTVASRLRRAREAFRERARLLERRPFESLEPRSSRPPLPALEGGAS